MRKIRKGEACLAPTPADRTATILRVMPFFTTDVETLSKIIGRIAGTPTHVGLLFERVDGWFYMEALWGRDVCPPTPLGDLTAWANRRHGRVAKAIELPTLTGEDAQSIYDRALETVTRETYHFTQLIEILGDIKFDRPVQPSAGKVICSEWSGLLLYPHVDLRPRFQRLWDRLTPQQMFTRALSTEDCTLHDLRKGVPA